VESWWRAWHNPQNSALIVSKRQVESRGIMIDINDRNQPSEQLYHNLSEVRTYIWKSLKHTAEQALSCAQAQEKRVGFQL